MGKVKRLCDQIFPSLTYFNEKHNNKDANPPYIIIKKLSPKEIDKWANKSSYKK